MLYECGVISCLSRICMLHFFQVVETPSASSWPSARVSAKVSARLVALGQSDFYHVTPTSDVLASIDD
jgi:hypothetical protein